MMTIIPVVICGGKGVRLWPLSRSSYPKPFIGLPLQQDSLISNTYHRLYFGTMPEITAVVTVTATDYIHHCKSAYDAIETSHRHIIIAEPCGCNTAAAIGSAAKVIAEQFGDEAVMLVMPADHSMANPAGFASVINKAIPAAKQNKIVLIGIPPTEPNTGYGYIRMGDEIFPGVCQVSSFIEKPDKTQAEKLLQEDNMVWNSGLFCLTAATALAEIKTHASDISAAIDNVFMYCDTSTDIIKPDLQHYEKIPSMSFDYAVAEKTNKAAIIVGASIGWSDIGAWKAVFEQTNATDDNNNTVLGDVHLLDCQQCLITSDNRCVVALGLKDTYIIDTADALLVSTAEHSEQLKKVVESLAGRKQVDDPTTVIRPWGSYSVISDAPNYKVKRIDVKAGGTLSYQSHEHRAEHWTIIEGELVVVIDDKETTLQRGESCYIPLRAKHRLINRTTDNAALIEVQIGDYLEEDDIIRYDDIYGRQDTSI